jgi:hypothetical protein
MNLWPKYHWLAFKTKEVHFWCKWVQVKLGFEKTLERSSPKKICSWFICRFFYNFHVKKKYLFFVPKQIQAPGENISNTYSAFIKKPRQCYQNWVDIHYISILSKSMLNYYLRLVKTGSTFPLLNDKFRLQGKTYSTR